MAQRRFTDDQLEEAVRSSYSIRAVLQRLGMTPAGGNYEVVQKRIAVLNLDNSHFLGKAILRGKSHSYGTRPLQEVLVHGKLENTSRLKERLLSQGLKAPRCEKCGGTKWLERAMPLELHHIDGDRTNNQLSNIELLCPNCHALTDNYRGGKKKA